MPAKNRYTLAQIEKLAQSLESWFNVPPDADEKTQVMYAGRVYFLEWCISENVPREVISRLSKRSKHFAQVVKKARDIQELRLAHLGLNIKNSPFCMFALKNLAGWRDDPDAAKGNKSNQLTIILGLPSKNTLSLPDKSKMVNAKATVIEESPLSKARKLVQAHEMAHQIPVKSKVKFRKLRQDTDSQPSVDVTLEASSVSPDEVGSNAVNTDQAKPLSSLSSVVGPAVSLSETSGGSLSDLIPPNDDTPLSGAASGSIPLSSLSLE